MCTLYEIIIVGHMIDVDDRVTDKDTHVQAFAMIAYMCMSILKHHIYGPVRAL